MDSTLQSWLTQSIRWEPFISQTGRGVPTYGAPVSLLGFIEGSQQMVRSRTGEERVTSWILYFADPRVATMTEKDRLTLPSGEQPPIIRISPVMDEKGNVDHYEVYL